MIVHVEADALSQTAPLTQPRKYPVGPSATSTYPLPGSPGCFACPLLVSLYDHQRKSEGVLLLRRQIHQGFVSG